MPVTNTQAIDAAAALSEVRGTGETLTALARRASRDLNDAHQLRDDEPTRLTPEGQRQAREDRRQGVRDRLASELDGVEREIARAERVIMGAADGAGGRRTDDVAAEMAEGRAWDRLRPLLDAGRSPLEVIGRAVDAVDARALIRELPTYLDARRTPSPGLGRLGDSDPDRGALLAALDGRLAEVVGGAEGRAIRTRVEARPALAAARARLDGVRAEYVRGRARGLLSGVFAAGRIERSGTVPEAAR